MKYIFLLLYFEGKSLQRDIKFNFSNTVETQDCNIKSYNISKLLAHTMDFGLASPQNNMSQFLQFLSLQCVSMCAYVCVSGES